MIPISEFKISGNELVRKEVKPVGTGGGVYLPKAWIGETVAIVRLGVGPGSIRWKEVYEIWSGDEKICDCDGEYDAFSRLELLQQLEPDRSFVIQGMSGCVDEFEDE